MQLLEEQDMESIQERGRMLQLQFKLFNQLAQLRIAEDPMRMCASRLPCSDVADFQQLEDTAELTARLDAQIAQLCESEERILKASGLEDLSEQAIYAELQKHQKQTNMKIISQPIGVQIGYALQNRQKLIARSHKNVQQQDIIGVGDLTPVDNAANETVYTKANAKVQEFEGVFEDAPFYQLVLKLSTQQSGNLDELAKLQNLQTQQRRLRKEYTVKSKNKSLDTQSQFKRLVGFMEPKRFQGNEEQAYLIRASLFGKQ